MRRTSATVRFSSDRVRVSNQQPSTNSGAAITVSAGWRNFPAIPAPDARRSRPETAHFDRVRRSGKLPTYLTSPGITARASRGRGRHALRRRACARRALHDAVRVFARTPCYGASHWAHDRQWLVTSPIAYLSDSMPVRMAGADCAAGLIGLACSKAAGSAPPYRVATSASARRARRHRPTAAIPTSPGRWPLASLTCSR
jgi:hypothetical protein